jgi:hypothetical protein
MNANAVIFHPAHHSSGYVTPLVKKFLSTSFTDFSEVSDGQSPFGTKALAMPNIAAEALLDVLMDKETYLNLGSGVVKAMCLSLGLPAIKAGELSIWITHYTDIIEVGLLVDSVLQVPLFLIHVKDGSVSGVLTDHIESRYADLEDGAGDLKLLTLSGGGDVKTISLKSGDDALPLGPAGEYFTSASFQGEVGFVFSDSPMLYSTYILHYYGPQIHLANTASLRFGHGTHSPLADPRNKEEIGTAVPPVFWPGALSAVQPAFAEQSYQSPVLKAEVTATPISAPAADSVNLEELDGPPMKWTIQNKVFTTYVIDSEYAQQLQANTKKDTLSEILVRSKVGVDLIHLVQDSDYRDDFIGLEIVLQVEMVYDGVKVFEAVPIPCARQSPSLAVIEKIKQLINTSSDIEGFASPSLVNQFVYGHLSFSVGQAQAGSHQYCTLTSEVFDPATLADPALKYAI